LRVPEGCGGRRTQCPNCHQTLTIPGASEAPDAAFVCAVIAPGPGTVTQEDVDHARREADRLKVIDLDLVAQLSRLNRRRQLEAARLALARTRLYVRNELDHSAGRSGGFFLALTLGAAGGLLLAGVSHLSVTGFVIAMAFGLSLAGSLYLPLAFLPEDDALRIAANETEATIAGITAMVRQLSAEEGRLASELHGAEREYRRLRAAIDSRLHYLRTCAWEKMTCNEFEQFLAKVFEERGYRVQRVGGTGEKGVDLIVDRNGSRIAVQAKGYVGQAVGNDAVQQAVAGSSHHGCQTSAVVTNSRFTFAARALAERIGCKLIDGDQIPDLVEGKIVV
jgi:hypothetical protein